MNRAAIKRTLQQTGLNVVALLQRIREKAATKVSSGITHPLCQERAQLLSWWIFRQLLFLLVCFLGQLTL
jgi:hypothetical protein